MKQTNVCLNIVFKFYEICIWGSRKLLYSQKSVQWKSKERKIEKRWALYTSLSDGSERRKPPLKEEKEDRFIARDMKSLYSSKVLLLFIIIVVDVRS